MSEPEVSTAPRPWAVWKSRLERLRKPLVVLAAVGTVLGGLAGYLNLYRAVKAPGASATVPAAASGYVAPVSLLVLPLVNLTGDAAKSYVADGLTAALVADLGRIEGAAVVPAAMAFGMQRENLTLQELGAKVRARFVLQGSVQASGSTLRVMAQLYDTASASTLWSETFDGAVERLFELQDAVTQRVRAAVAPTMTLRAAEDARKRPETANAADLMLRYEALRIQPQSLANHREMEHLARAALNADPENLGAMAALARTLSLMAGNFSSQIGDVQVEKRLGSEAVDLARKVYQRSPSSESVFLILAADNYFRGDFSAALEWARRMGASRRHNNASVIYRDLGLLDEARRQIEAELARPEFRPRNDPRLNMAHVALLQGRPEEAIRWSQEAIAIDPERDLAYYMLARANGMLKDEPRARAASAELFKRAPKFRSPLSKLHAEGRLWPLMDPAARETLRQRLVAAEAVAGIQQE